MLLPKKDVGIKYRMNYLIIGLGVLIILLIYILYQYFTKKDSVLTKEGSLKTAIPNITNIDKPTSSRYAYGIWIYVNTWDPTQEKTIFSRAENLQLYLDKSSPSLKCRVKMSNEEVGKMSEEIIITDNFPLQKWTHIIVSVDNQFVDTYLDGKLVKSQRFFNPEGNIMPLVPGKEGNISFGQFDAYVKDFKRWTQPMDPQTALNEFIKGSEFGAVEKVFANDGVDISILKNNELQKKFSLF